MAGVQQISGRMLKHELIAKQLEDSIRGGSLAGGDALPAEVDLAQHFQVSRGTVRRALEELNRRRLITTENGRGSFVSFHGHEIDRPGGWARALVESGTGVSTEILRLELTTDLLLTTELDGAESEFVLIERLRRLPTGTVISFERALVPAVGPLAQIPTEGLIEGSLTKTLDAAGLVATNGEQWVEVVALESEAAAILKASKGTRFLRTTRLSQDPTGRFVEKVTSLLHPDHFRIHHRF